MAATGGSIQEIALNSRVFAVAADAEANRKLGGWNNEVEANGNGSARIIKTRVNWALTGLAIEVDDTRGDHEYLQGIADAQDFFPVVVTYANGESYSGRGQITNEIEHQSKPTTLTLDLAGEGVLTKL